MTGLSKHDLERYYELMRTLEPGDLLHIPIMYRSFSIDSTTEDLSNTERLEEPEIVYICILEATDGDLGLSDIKLNEDELTSNVVMTVTWDEAANCFHTPEGRVPFWSSPEIVVAKHEHLELIKTFRDKVTGEAELTFDPKTGQYSRYF